MNRAFDTSHYYKIVSEAGIHEKIIRLPHPTHWKYVLYNRWCGGGTSFLVRHEEKQDGKDTCHAHAIVATYADNGIESSSFPTIPEAQLFVKQAISTPLWIKN